MTTPTETPPADTAPKLLRLDLRAMLDKLKLPGVDSQKLIESRRKDIEALLMANERAFAAIEALTRKQADMLADVMKEWQAGAKDVGASTGGIDKLNQATIHAQRAFSHALMSMKDMAEIVAKSSQDVVAIINNRYHEGLEELRGSIHKKE